AHPGYPQTGLSFTRNIDSLVQQYLLEKDLPSAAIGIVQGDEIIYAKRLLHPKAALPKDAKEERAIYNIASVAKPFLATAILMLEAEGKLQLEDPIVKYLPEFKINSKYQNEISIQHLLTHSSGLPSVYPPDAYEYKSVDTSDQALEKHIRSLSSVKLAFRPGKKFAYSNVGFEVLGYLICRLSGQTFPEFMQNRLFQPLGMERSSYILSDFKKEALALPHQGHPYKETERFPYHRAFSPSGNLFISIQDLSKWMLFNLNLGQYQETRLLSENRYKKLVTPQLDSKEDGLMGLSWFLKPEHKIIFHDGLDMGYSALMVLFPESSIGISVMVNHQEANGNEILNLILK
ncbi:MAG: serine hydrolase domain-containing protein, partial [Bacteroidota bacterium]